MVTVAEFNVILKLKLTPFFLGETEAAAKREAQLQAKKDAEEKRRLAAEGECFYFHSVNLIVL